MTSVRTCQRVVGAAAGLAVAAAALAACPASSQDLGVAAFESSDGEATSFDSPSITEVGPFDAGDGGPEATTPLSGSVASAAGTPVGMALVAIEVGGLNRKNPGAIGPDGGLVGTLEIDPFYRYGTVTGARGNFSLDVPDEPLGVHVYQSGYFCGVPEAGVLPAGAGKVTVRLVPLPAPEGGADASADGGVEGGSSTLPTVASFSIVPNPAIPYQPITLTAYVTAPDPSSDPLSEQVLAVEPKTGWAGIFAPPTPGKPGVGYPNGVYGRLFQAPAEVGAYTFYMVAATQSCVVSPIASATLYVTETGEGGPGG